MFNPTKLVIDAFVEELKQNYTRTYGLLEPEYPNIIAYGEEGGLHANSALTVIIAILIVLLFGLSYVARAYGVTAMDPDASNFQSVLSIEVAAVFGRGWFYFLTMGSVLAALAFSANTAFADFPRMARAIILRRMSAVSRCSASHQPSLPSGKTARAIAM